MNEKPCLDHSGLCTEVSLVEKKLDSEITDRKTENTELWKGINQIKAWVIGGMGSTILAMSLFILSLIFPHVGGSR